MSDYRALYSSSRGDTAPLKSAHYIPRDYTSRISTANNLSYQDLKEEYSKVLNYVDSIRHDRNYCKSPSSNMERKTSTGLISPSRVERSPPSNGRIRQAYQYPEYEKRIVEYEQEVNELKKLLETNEIRFLALQDENKILKEEIKDFRQRDQLNKHLGNDMNALDNDVINLTKRLKEIEKENYRLRSQRGDLFMCDPQEIQRNITKYGHYIIYLLGTLENDHFGRFCFEERFDNQKKFLEMVEEKAKDKLLLQGFRYLADLLLNVSSTAKASNMKTIIYPKKQGQAYLVELNGTDHPASIRSTTPTHFINRQDLTHRRSVIQQEKEYERTKESNKSLIRESDRRDHNEDGRYIKTERYNDKKDSIDQMRDRESFRNPHYVSEPKQYSDSKYSSNVVDSSEQSYKEGSQYTEKTKMQRNENKYYEEKERKYENKFKKEDKKYNDDEKSEYTETERSETDHKIYKKYKSSHEKKEKSKPDSMSFNQERERESSYRKNYKSQEHFNNERQYNQKYEQDYRDSNQRNHYDERQYSDQRRYQPDSIRKESRRPSTPDMRFSESTPKLGTESGGFSPHVARLELDSYRRVATEGAHSPYNEGKPINFTNNQKQLKSQKSQGAHSHKQSEYQEESFESQSREYEPLLEEQPRNKKHSEVSRQSNNNTPAKTQHHDGNKPKLQNMNSGSRYLSKQSTAKSVNLSKMYQSKSGSNDSNNSEEDYDPNPTLARSHKKPRRETESIHEDLTIRPHWNPEDLVETPQYQNRPVPTKQQREEEYETHSTSSTKKKGPSRQSSAHLSVNTNGTVKKESKLKSPSSGSSKPIIPVLKTKTKEKIIPAPIDTQSAQDLYQTRKVLSPSSSSVSQSVYSKNRSLQISGSPIPTSPSKSEMMSPHNFIKKDIELLEKEKELVQKIRELNKKERELIEREQEMEGKSQQFKALKSLPVNQRKQVESSQDYRQSSIKEPRVVIKSPPNSTKDRKHFYFEERGNRGDESERYRELDDNAVDYYSQERIDTASSQDALDSGRLKSILKKSDSRLETQNDRNHGKFLVTKESMNSNPSGFQDGRGQQRGVEEQSESEIYEENEENEGKDVYTFRNENNQKKTPPVSSDRNHQKRLTFGAESNFDPEVISSQNNFSNVEEKESPQSGPQISPIKQDNKEIGTNYPSFRVAFGKTESKYKRSHSPDLPLALNINEIPKRKKVDHIDQTYDVVRGIEIKKNKSKTPTGLNSIETDFGSVVSGWTKDLSQITPSDIGSGQKGIINKEIILSPTSETRVNTLNE